MKRLRKFTGVLAAALCICVCSAALSACKNYVEYEGFLLYGHNSYYSIGGIADIDDFSGDVHIPSEYNGLPITTIDSLEFWSKSFDNLYIGENITSITYLSGNFSSVYFPKALHTVYHFRGNKGTLWLEEGNESFFCRNNCLIQEGEVILAGENASIPDDGSVTSIGEWAFSGCSRLTSIAIPASVTKIDCTAFDSCTSLKGVYITDIAAWCGILFKKPDKGSFHYPLEYARNLYLNGTLVSELVIPDGVTSIGEHAFYRCKSLTSVVIPDSVTEIGEYAFESCTNLKTVYNRSTLEFTKGSTNNGYVAYYAENIYTNS